MMDSLIIEAMLFLYIYEITRKINGVQKVAEIKRTSNN
jgi:hypothetical protein